MRAGRHSGEMDCLGKNRSARKVGCLAKAWWPASVYTYAISDVPGDEATVIASGPTVADPTTSAEALAILERYHIEVPTNVLAWPEDPRSEKLKPRHPKISSSHFQLIAPPDRKTVGEGNRDDLRVDLGVRRRIETKTK